MAHKLKHSVSRHKAPIVDSLFGELTLLGAIGLFFFVLEQTTVLPTMSDAIFGEQHTGMVAHIVHQVDLALFLVMCTFLALIYILVEQAARVSAQWKKYELEAGHKDMAEARFNAAHADMDAEMPVGRVWWCCNERGRRHAKLVQAREELTYIAMRERFVKPPLTLVTSLKNDPRNAAATPMAELSWGPAPDGSHFLRLKQDSARRYRKKIEVYAFKSNDPCKFEKGWGESAGGRGDWVLTPRDNVSDVYSCPNDVFERSYAPIEGHPHMYRKTDTVLAQPMHKPFWANGKKSPLRGEQGDYLVQAGDREQYVVPAKQFKSMYVPVTGVGFDRDNSHDLPADFDFSLYLTSLMNHVIAEMVDVSGVTWVAIEIIIVVLWTVRTLGGTTAFTIVASLVGYNMVAMQCVLLYYFRRARDYLVPHKLLPRRRMTWRGFCGLPERESLNDLYQANLRVGSKLNLINTSSPHGSRASRHSPSPSHGRDGSPKSSTKSSPRPLKSPVPHSSGAGAAASAAASPSAGARAGGTAMPSPGPVDAVTTQMSGRFTFSSNDSEGAQMRRSALRKTMSMRAQVVHVGNRADTGKPRLIDDIATCVQDGSLGVPPYEALPQQPPPKTWCCGRCGGGRAPTRQESLFMFGTHGPHVALHVIRLLLLIIALYISMGSMVIATEQCRIGVGWCTLSVIALALPAFASMLLLPHLIAAFVVVSSVETMKSQSTVNDVVRQNKTTRSLRALKMLSAMKAQVRRSRKADAAGSAGGGGGGGTSGGESPRPIGVGGGGGSSAGPEPLRLKSMSEVRSATPTPRLDGSEETKQTPSGRAVSGAASATVGQSAARNLEGAAERMYGAPTSAPYRRRYNELMEVFRIFDREGDGHVSVKDMASVLEMLGMADKASDQAALIVAEVDDDGSGEVEFMEFFNWMALREEEGGGAGTTEGLSREIFDMIDSDGSGEITAGELSDVLASLGEVMSPDDIAHVVKELDTDGSGTVSFDEFDEFMRAQAKETESARA